MESAVELNDVQLANRVIWVRGLLSGNYEQGNGVLRRKDSEDSKVKYCCLGVACELVIPHSRDLVLTSLGQTQSSALMNRVDAATAFGMVDDDQTTAAGWNDRSRQDFSRIADFVAYATAHGIRFSVVDHVEVTGGYAVEWLKQFN